jgi:hypothetical protein
MPVEQRTLTSGVLSKKPRIGDWHMPISTIEIRRHWRELYRKAKTVTTWMLSRNICIEGRVSCALRLSQSESRMPEIGTSGLMSGERKRSQGEE